MVTVATWVPCMDDAGLVLVLAGQVMCPPRGVPAAQPSSPGPCHIPGTRPCTQGNHEPGDGVAV